MLKTRSNCSFVSTSRVVALSLVLASVFSIATNAIALSGKWTPAQDIGGTAVHLALIPGDGHPYHSRILWWQEEGSTVFIGGQWGWRDSSGIDCQSYPQSVLTPLGLPDPGRNIFCSGFAQLPDGRLVVVGGTESQTENGMKHVFTFKPDTGRGAGAWTQVDSMYDRRWYPSVTVLNNGRVLASSGSKYPHIDFFGGRKDGAALAKDRSLGRYGLLYQGLWDAPIPPLAPSSPFWPGAHSGHTTTTLSRLRA